MRKRDIENGAQKPVRDKRKLIKQIALFLCCAIIFGILSFSVIQIYIVQSTKEYLISEVNDAPVCDAVIVLGAYVYNSGTPSPVLRDRLDYGYEMYKQGKAQKILVSGDHGRENYDEVNVMKEYLIRKGVPGEDIFMDHAGFNTYDSMYRARDIFQIENLLISTQKFHMSRSLYIARSLGINAYGYPCEDKAMYRMAYLNTRESVARVKAFLDVLVNRNPKFLGDVIPITGDGNQTAG